MSCRLWQSSPRSWPAQSQAPTANAFSQPFSAVEGRAAGEEEERGVAREGGRCGVETASLWRCLADAGSGGAVGPGRRGRLGDGISAAPL
jgi:hypothetical protein